MGMTDNQWKDNLRNQIEDWEEVEKLFREGKSEEGFAKIEKTLRRLKEGLQD